MEQIDTQNMEKVLLNFPRHLRDAIKIGNDIKIPSFDFDNIIYCGMGGSAISGDIIASLVKKVPVYVSRSYEIPDWVGEKTLAFVSSYSGNTEETLSAYSELEKRGVNTICISSGGKLAEQNPRLLVGIPSGFQPRCAIGYLFFVPFIILRKIGIVDGNIEEVITLTEGMGREMEKDNGRASILAKGLVGKFPIIYASSPLEPVAKRWQAQLNENSKVLAHINFFPELNHNEIVGFGYPEIDTIIIILQDKGYSERIKKRIDITKELLSPFTSGIEEVYTEGDSLLTRLFSLIYTGDWVSYHLAIKRDIDPTPVKRIDELKDRLKDREPSRKKLIVNSE